MRAGTNYFSLIVKPVANFLTGRNKRSQAQAFRSKVEVDANVKSFGGYLLKYPAVKIPDPADAWVLRQDIGGTGGYNPGYMRPFVFFSEAFQKERCAQDVAHRADLDDKYLFLIFAQRNRNISFAGSALYAVYFMEPAGPV
jgi:hypothetical protein